VDVSVVATLNGLTIMDGDAASDFLNFGGGGVVSAGTLIVNNCTLSSNLAVGGNGGGISNDGTMTLNDVTLFGNSTNAEGGGIFNAATLTAINCTLSGNTASESGGGIYNAAGTASVSACTIAGNLAGSQGGGIDDQATVTLVNSIIGGNSAAGAPSDIFGSGDTLTGNNNLIGSTTGFTGISNGSSGNIVGATSARIGLGPLAYNGGPRETMALLPNSLALNGGSPNGTPDTDERGAARDNPPDIGAFEVQFPLSPVGVPETNAALFSPHPNADATTAFVKGLYQGFLDRAADAAGLAYWVGELQSNAMTRTQVAQGFVNSRENRTNQVTFFYQYFLARATDQDGLNYWVGQLQSGVDEATVMEDFLLSPEYTGKNNNAAFVNTMYYSILGRAADMNGFNYWTGQLNGNSVTRQQVAAAFIRSDEAVKRYIDNLCIDFLKRPADSATYSNFMPQIEGGATFGSVEAEIVSSNEFFNNAAANVP
jgi:Domain of unknown function (DUF4214)